ncbi:N-acyl homoserine lactonase family protein [Paludibacterium yongneupense]|uniref:N-acyl homoserine lactonase family protein n=1 Tax=Paludibacterium yongneupense TaxID=400061 RepID=UPI00048E8FF7|nr:N-acyl homoserine lactonase family protein [Paludibacterium yongneupense]
MSQTRLYFLSSGVLESEKHYFTLNRGQGEAFTVPVPFFFVEHDGARVLLDTGNSIKVCANPREHWGSAVDAYYPRMGPSDYVVNQLAALGCAPEAVTHIVLSHLHLDHAGGIKSFPGARLVVQQREYDWAFSEANTQHGAYIQADLTGIAARQWLCIDGEFDLFGDGSVCAFPTPGHTPGHQSFLIRLASGKRFVLTGDACYTTENLEEDIPPGLVWDAETSRASMQAIRRIARENGAEVIVGHDPVAWGAWRHAPAFYS